MKAKIEEHILIKIIISNFVRDYINIFDICILQYFLFKLLSCMFSWRISSFVSHPKVSAFQCGPKKLTSQLFWHCIEKCKVCIIYVSTHVFIIWCKYSAKEWALYRDATAATSASSSIFIGWYSFIKSEVRNSWRSLLLFCSWRAALMTPVHDCIVWKCLSFM